jgi:hypothetical protein
MAISVPVAYNTGSLISGTQQTGSLAIGDSNQRYDLNYGGVRWFMSPDIELGYVIGYPVPSNTHPTPIGVVPPSASIGFKGTKNLPNPFFEQTFVQLTNNSFNQNFTTGNAASAWLGANGYWNTWISSSSFLLQENGSYLLQENGDRLILTF